MSVHPLTPQNAFNLTRLIFNSLKRPFSSVESDTRVRFIKSSLKTSTITFINKFKIAKVKVERILCRDEHDKRFKGTRSEIIYFYWIFMGRRLSIESRNLIFSV